MERLFYPNNNEWLKSLDLIACIKYLDQLRVMNKLPVRLIDGATRKDFDLAALGTIVAKIKFLEVVNADLIEKRIYK